MGNHEAAGGYPQNAGVLVVLVDTFRDNSLWHNKDKHLSQHWFR